MCSHPAPNTLVYLVQLRCIDPLFVIAREQQRVSNLQFFRTWEGQKLQLQKIAQVSRLGHIIDQKLCNMLGKQSLSTFKPHKKAVMNLSKIQIEILKSSTTKLWQLSRQMIYEKKCADLCADILLQHKYKQTFS